MKKKLSKKDNLFIWGKKMNNNYKLTLITISVLIVLLFGGLLIKIYFNPEDNSPEITNEIEEWDYTIFGYNTIHSGDKSYQIPITKLYRDSFCNATIYPHGLPISFNIRIENQKRTATQPFYLDLSGDLSNTTIKLEYELNNKTMNYSYTCYGKFVGFSK